MKKYLPIFNIHTLLILVLSMLCSFISLRFQISIYLDFIFLGVFIAIPLAFTLREAFRRRERAIQYLSAFSAALKSSYFYFEISNLERNEKLKFKNILINVSDKLMQYLSAKTEDASSVQKASDSVFIFMQANKENYKGRFTEKILSFQFRINESIDFLLATKRHHTPWGIRATILFAIYTFVIFYPASLLGGTGFDVALWYVFVMTGFKGFILISLCNVQKLLEDPFDQNSPEAIRLNDFRFYVHE